MTVNSKNIGVILRQAPYGHTLAQEALDALLALSVYGQAPTVIFMGDGVFQLVAKQESQGIGQKSVEKKLAAFELYDIESVFICADSLAQRQLSQEDLAVAGTVVAQGALIDLLHQQDALLSF